MSTQLKGSAGLPVLVEPKLTPTATAVLEHRYLIRNEDGQVIETPAQMFRRVASAVAKAEITFGTSTQECHQLESVFYEAMAARRFLPNSPCLMNAGRSLGMLSACFVLPLEDSIVAIMDTARQTALVQRSGGGTGIDLSQLRPNGSVVRSSGGTTAGPLSFLKMLSGVTDAIQQGAFRRGANMGVLRIDHPDIIDFICLKSDLMQLSNFNLSVAVTDDFMQSLASDPLQLHVVTSPHTGQKGVLVKETGRAEYATPLSAQKDRYYSVANVWTRIIEQAWQSGEPGVIYIDEVNRHNPTPHLGALRATNPCGEQPLLPYEACTLGSINLLSVLKPACSETDDHIDWTLLRETVDLAVRFLDDVIEVSRYPTPEIEKATLATRKIGLGVMGFADLLFAVGVPYDSEKALQIAERIGSFVRDAGWAASQRLAETRGAFPSWKGSVWETSRGGRLMRNAQVTTIAPTGTISIIASRSSGIEPVFSLGFKRQILDGQNHDEVNPLFEAALREELSDESRINETIKHACANGSIQDVPGIPDRLKAVFRTAHDISPEWHVRMQAAWQQNADAAVSKTVNLPANASTRDVERAYSLAYELKCKGVTVYRDGARPLQPIVRTSQPPAQPAVGPTQPAKLPEVLPAIRIRQPTPFGNMHLNISVDPETGLERELFAQLGKGGDLANSDLEAVCRLASLLLRSGVGISHIIDQLDGIGSSLSIPSRDGRIKSLGDAIAKALRKYRHAKERDSLEALLSGRVKTLERPDSTAVPPRQDQQEALFHIKCPECGSTRSLAFEEGCLHCRSCGYSRC